MISPRGAALHDVNAERERQERLKAEGRFKYTCADAEMSDGECFLVLGEEVGEVARAALEVGGLANDKHGAELRKELIQVAAVCVAWVERIDREVERVLTASAPSVEFNPCHFCGDLTRHMGVVASTGITAVCRAPECREKSIVKGSFVVKAGHECVGTNGCAAWDCDRL